METSIVGAAVGEREWCPSGEPCPAAVAEGLLPRDARALAPPPAGLENGLSEDDLIAIELGAASLEDLTEVQRAYVEKLKDKLVLVRAFGGGGLGRRGRGGLEPWGCCQPPSSGAAQRACVTKRSRADGGAAPTARGGHAPLRRRARRCSQQPAAPKPAPNGAPRLRSNPLRPQRIQELRVEEAARRAREAKYFEAGKAAYERGEYPDAVACFERAVEDNGRQSAIGGDALMWLALAYQVGGRRGAGGRGAGGYRWRGYASRAAPCERAPGPPFPNAAPCGLTPFPGRGPRPGLH
jgi:hypothetical protein